MFSNLLPKEFAYFDFFDLHAGITVKCAKVFLSTIVSSQDITENVRMIKKLELEAGAIKRQCNEMLHKTFITPFDREDVFHLICKMDAIINNINAAADCLLLYNIATILPAAKDLAQLLVSSTLEIQTAIGMLKNLKRSPEIRKRCMTISLYESEGDLLRRNAIARLFAEEQDTRMLIKWKEIYEHLEKALDKCKDVANVIEGVILEYS